MSEMYLSIQQHPAWVCLYTLLTLECSSKLVSSKGVERLYGIIKDMTGERASPIFKICWRYLTPLISLVSLTFSHEYMCIKNVPLYSIVPCEVQIVHIPRLLLESVIIFLRALLHVL